jgi:hypothetical protein
MNFRSSSGSAGQGSARPVAARDQASRYARSEARAQGVGAHTRIGEMLQCGDIGIGQDFGIAIGSRHRQDSRESVKLYGALDLRCRTGQWSLPLCLKLSSDGTMLNTE